MDLTLRNRSLDIGGQTYPLQAIARVGIWHYTIAKTTYYKPAAVVGFLGLLLAASGEAGAVVLGVLMLIGAGALCYVSLERKDKDLYSLRLETAGSPRDALYSEDRNAVVDLRDKIVDHMERPSEQTITMNLGDTFINGDQVNMEGAGNTGKVVA